jgi:hypothetical protein
MRLGLAGAILTKLMQRDQARESEKHTQSYLIYVYDYGRPNT